VGESKQHICKSFDINELIFRVSAGDSGGPLLCQRRSSCDWYIAGITSFGKGCASPGVYGAWTNVEFFESWVSEQTGIPIYKSHRENNTGIVKF